MDKMWKNRENRFLVQSLLEEILETLPIPPGTYENEFPVVDHGQRERLGQELIDPDANQQNSIKIEKKVRKPIAYWIWLEDEKKVKFVCEKSVQPDVAEMVPKSILKGADTKKKQLPRNTVRFSFPEATDKGDTEQKPTSSKEKKKRVPKWLKALFCCCWKVAEGKSED